MICLITGGERSGKSKHACKLAMELTSSPVYLATARIWDEDFKKRIERHQKERDDRWINMEEEKHIGDIDLENKVVVIDCVTLWLTNIYTDCNYSVEKTLELAGIEIEKIRKKEGTFIFVSNEIGMGVHAKNETGRKFVEIQGWINQLIAKIADKVIFMVSGIPLIIKEEIK